VLRMRRRARLQWIFPDAGGRDFHALKPMTPQCFGGDSIIRCRPGNIRRGKFHE